MRSDYSSWLNTTLWTVSSLQLLIDIGREVLSLSQTLAHQIRPRRPLRLPPISEPIQVNSTHRAPWIHPEPSSRGPGARTNDSTIETSSALQSASEQTTPHTRSEHVTTHDAGPSQPDSNSQGPNKPITRLLLYGANNEGDVFIGDMRKLARACHRHLGSHSQVDDRVVMGDIGFEFRTFFSQTNVRIQDMLVFGASGHGRIDIFMFINRLPFHCTIEVFLDVCHAALAAEQHGLYKTWPPDAFISTSNLPDGAVRPRTGPKVILWTAAGRRGLAYFRRGKDSYMLAAMCKTLKAHGPNITRRELYRKIMERLAPLNERLRRKNTAPQIPVIFSSVPDRDPVLDGYALQPLLLADDQGIA